MKLPKGWKRLEAGLYESDDKQRQVLKLDRVWRRSDYTTHEHLGGYRTAREAFAALGVEV